MELLQFDLKEDNVQIYYVWNKEIKTANELAKLSPMIWKEFTFRTTKHYRWVKSPQKCLDNIKQKGHPANKQCCSRGITILTYFAYSQVMLLGSLVLESFCFCCMTFPSHVNTFGQRLQVANLCLLFSKLRKGRLHCIRPVGQSVARSVGWSAGWSV